MRAGLGAPDARRVGRAGCALMSFLGCLRAGGVAGLGEAFSGQLAQSRAHVAIFLTAGKHFQGMFESFELGFADQDAGVVAAVTESSTFLAVTRTRSRRPRSAAQIGRAHV